MQYHKLTVEKARSERKNQQLKHEARIIKWYIDVMEEGRCVKDIMDRYDLDKK